MEADRPREPRVGGLLARGLRKEYPAPGGPLVVLDDVSLELGRGETLAILGPSGSGKSTLLNILGGLEPPSGGSVTLEGTDPYRLSEPQQARFRNESVGFVFQEHYLLPQLTLLENVLLPTLMRADRSSAGYLERARALLERVGLGARLAHFPSELSGGERQRGAVARALVGRPALLLADEPTGNLDRRAAAEVGEMLLALGREEGSILIVVTHSVELARGFSRKVRLESGRLEVESWKSEVGS